MHGMLLILRGFHLTLKHDAGILTSLLQTALSPPVSPAWKTWHRCLSQSSNWPRLVPFKITATRFRRWIEQLKANVNGQIFQDNVISRAWWRLIIEVSRCRTLHDTWVMLCRSLVGKRPSILGYNKSRNALLFIDPEFDPKRSGVLMHPGAGQPHIMCSRSRLPENTSCVLLDGEGRRICTCNEMSYYIPMAHLPGKGCFEERMTAHSVSSRRRRW